MATVRSALGRLMVWPPVAAAIRVLARYNAVDGGLLAGGLAYAALFAIVPAIFLATGIVGLLVGDPARRGDATAFITAVLPPLHDLVQAVLGEAGRDAGAIGLVGAVTLTWGASRFVVTFSDAVARTMGRPRRRGALARNVAAIIAVLLVPFAIVAGATLAGLSSFLGLAQEHGVISVIGEAAGFVLGFAPALATILVVGLVYRLVPTPPAAWQAIGPPAVVAGLGLTILLQAFVFLAPRFIGAAALLGTIATVFAALAWLSLSFQVVLLGAAWVGDREATMAPRAGT